MWLSSLISCLTMEKKFLQTIKKLIQTLVKLKIGHTNFITILWSDMCQKWWQRLPPLLFQLYLLFFLHIPEYIGLKMLKKNFMNHPMIFLFFGLLYVWVLFSFYDGTMWINVWLSYYDESKYWIVCSILVGKLYHQVFVKKKY